MRLKSHIWVSAYLRRLDTAFIPAVVSRRGDADAGAIYIKLFQRDGTSQVLAPISATLVDPAHKTHFVQEEGRTWQPVYNDNTHETDADAYLHRQASYDPDIWVLEVEAEPNRHLLGEAALASAWA